MTHLLPFLLIPAAYLLGSIPTAVWVGRIFFRLDIREHGSGNAGATNTIRVMGWKAGIPVFAFDVFKGWLAVKAADLLLALPADDPYLLMWKIILATAVVIGHVYPVFAGFRGGKGVATMLGVGMALYPVSVWIVILVFILVLLISGYVSLGSIIAAISFPFIDIFLFQQPSTLLIGLSVFVALFIPVTHRKNIIRLLKGEESKFRPGKSKKMPDH